MCICRLGEYCSERCMCAGQFETCLECSSGGSGLGSRWDEGLELLRGVSVAGSKLCLGLWGKRWDIRSVRFEFLSLCLPNTCRWSNQCISPGAYRGSTGVSQDFENVLKLVDWVLLFAFPYCWWSAVACLCMPNNSKNVGICSHTAKTINIFSRMSVMVLYGHIWSELLWSSGVGGSRVTVPRGWSAFTSPGCPNLPREEISCWIFYRNPTGSYVGRFTIVISKIPFFTVTLYSYQSKINFVITVSYLCDKNCSLWTCLSLENWSLRPASKLYMIRFMVDIQLCTGNESTKRLSRLVVAHGGDEQQSYIATTSRALTRCAMPRSSGSVSSLPPP